MAVNVDRVVLLVGIVKQICGKFGAEHAANRLVYHTFVDLARSHKVAQIVFVGVIDHFHIDSAFGGEPRAVAGGFGNALIPKLHYGIVIADNKAVEAHLLLEELTKQLLR